MKQRIATLVLVASLAASACETAEGYRQQMTDWQGRSSDDLLLQWGPPTQKATMTDGREMWSYQKQTTTQTAGYYQDQTRQVTRTFTDKDGKQRQETISETYPVWQPPTTNTLACNTRFVISKQHRVDLVTFDGSACVAPERKN
ncbi:MAG: hypothetical protein GC155_05345 [Alphaproteobacteria bacterium]|nr:hypothetical protein [Alphaproteobacteria bacterium]